MDKSGVQPSIESLCANIKLEQESDSTNAVLKGSTNFLIGLVIIISDPFMSHKI